MTLALPARAWPGSLDWGGNWLADAAEELARLGFVLRDGSLPGSVPGPRLLVALRDRPTLVHFDPEAVSFWEAREGRGAVAHVDRLTELRDARPWSWGRLRIVDRVPVSNQFLGFGGTLLAGRCTEEETILAFVSRAPIVRWAGHSQGVDPLVDEIGAFFARLKVPLVDRPDAEARIAAADPEALYAVFLAHSRERIRHSLRLREADLPLATWIEHECHRMASDSPAAWEAGLELLDWLELG